MIEITERQDAQKRIEAIKSALVESQVDYVLCETPYKLSINLKKKLLIDHSPKLMTSISESQVSTAFINSTTSQDLFSNTSSPVSSPNDSGIGLNCMSCENSQKIANDTRKELVENILESKVKVKDYQNVIAAKDNLIKQLENRLKTTEDDRNKYKMERDAKHEQLKLKNKTFEKEVSKFQKEKEQHENMISNYTNKVENLETSVKKLNLTLCEKTELLKQERTKSKKREKMKKTMTKSTEIDPLILESSSTQTDPKEVKNVQTEISKYPNHQHKETFIEEKYFIFLKDKIFSDICFPKTALHARKRSNSVPSRSKVNMIKSSKGIATKIVNPNEAPWDAIDPDDNKTVASALYLTRDIAGFFCATASNMGRTDWIEDMIDEMTDQMGNIT